MADALEILHVLQAVDVEAIAIESLRSAEGAMADLNAEQLARGLRADGSEILPSYADLTIELKEGKSGLSGVTDHVTLYDQGDHYRELYAKVIGQEYEQGSRDPKSEALQKKYDKKGGSIYGITVDSREELINGPVGEAWTKGIEAATGLKLQ